jgi:UDP:flavonoid glycosyltransferase YjiC (YdhE family)
VSAWIDGYPGFLEDPSVVRSGRRIPIRPEPHSAAADHPSQDAPVHDPSSPTVLVTMGTVFTGQELLDEMVASIEAVGVPLTLLITSVNGISARGTADDSPVRIVDVPFFPLAELLEGVDAVVTVGGAGTVLGALTAGVPLVVMPLGADHEINAARAVAAGAAVRVSTPGEVGPALLSDLLADGALLCAARATAGRIRVLPAASTALDALADVINPFAATPAAAIRLENQQ